MHPTTRTTLAALLLSAALPISGALAQDAGTSGSMSGQGGTGMEAGGSMSNSGSMSTTGSPSSMESGATTTTTTTTTTTDSGMSGSTGSMSGDSEVLAEVEKSSAGSARERTAEMQTKLLNRFSQLGFSDVREFRREGETYMTEAKTAEGEWVNVVLDPTSGTILARK